MQLICVSRGSYSSGRAFAESLASKLGCACLGREQLLERATDAGVAAGKLEMACLRPRGLNERMLLEREHFHAFATAMLAEQALSGPLVYHGRTGHLLLPGVPHVLRLRVMADMEARIKSVEERLGLNRAKARRYIEQVEEDRHKWAKTFYNVDWDASSGYDFVVNLERANVGNAASAFCSVAQLPEFQQTPAARRTLENLRLAGRCRVALANDDRTYFASFRVRAENGVVSVQYLPRHAKVAEVIPEILKTVPGVERLLCTMAATRILWVEERFDPKGDSFKHLLEIAEKWGAAVELLRFAAREDAPPIIERPTAAETGLLPSDRASAGGIEEDGRAEAETGAADDGGLEETCTELIRTGRAGGRITVHGTANDVLSAIDRTATYSLVVVGDAFLSKGKAARMRSTRELEGILREQMEVAVIQAQEMKKEYLFGARQLLAMLVCFGLTFVVYYLVFSNQQSVLRLLTREGTQWRVLAAVSVFVFVPSIAYVYGKAAHFMLKLIKME